MSNLRQKLQTLCIMLLLGIVTVAAQEIRYVKPTTNGGDNTKDGTSWATAKADIQVAINDLANNNLTGEVWVAEGTYYPTESTESSPSPLYKSFKIPAGITVRGGFRNDLTAADDGKNDKTTRPVVADKNFGNVFTEAKDIDGDKSYGGVYSHKTILCGDVTPSKQAKFEWNPTKQQFDVTFYGNSYHVVWFAMNGFNADHRANPLIKPAKLEGCVIQGGHASAGTINDEHPHMSYGGGIYMVANSFVYNCEVKNCDASRNGGGIYMDGGGIVRRTYVHDCQALGLGAEFGLGGGICEDGAKHNSKKNPVVVAQSVVTNCVGRMGGGMALVADNTVGNNKYAVVANTTLVNNNTAQEEAGGVYAHKGGAVAGMTIVRNKCNGSGIMQDDVVTGRSGGLYNRDATYVCNTVVWGNECGVNQDVQYASSRTNLTGSEKTKFYYNAVSKMDNTDWSGTTRMGVLSLDDANTSGTKGTKGYPLFFKPTTTAGYLNTIDENDITKDDDASAQDAKKALWFNWTVSSESFLSYAGIATIDLDTDGYTPAPEENYDMQFGKFNARPTLGAFISQVADIAPAEKDKNYTNAEKAPGKQPGIFAGVTYKDVTYDYAFFVDPDFVYSGDNPNDNGIDWERPVRFLGNVLDFIENQKSTYGTKKVAIFVKQGAVDNTRTLGDSRIRETSLDIPSSVSIFGSFSSALTGTTVENPNVVRTPTVISAKLMDNYKFNIAHLVTINNKQNVNIEGFKLSYANASSTELNNKNVDGAAITIIGSNTGIKFRNIIVSNCTADHGAAVYASGSTVNFENCIFHNNTSKTLANSGIVYAVNGAKLYFDHCDVLRNVGHASYIGNNNTKNEWKNSIFYGNMDRTMPDTNIDSDNSDPSNPGLNIHAVAAFSGVTGSASGNHCMFDAKSASFSSQFGGNDTGNQWQYNLQYAFVDGTGQGYPRFINPTKNAGVTEDGDQTYYGRATSFEPHNNNPIVNLAADAVVGKDIIDITRNYGGLPDIGAVENHEADKKTEGENAYTDGQKKLGEVMYVRDYTATGTQIDTYDFTSPSTYTKNAEGKGIYRQTAAGSGEYELLDGSSWERAINGNADYSLSGKRTYRAVNEKRVLAYKINNSGYYLDVENGTLHRVKGGTPYIDPETGEKYDPADRATVFILCDATGKEMLYDAGKTPKDGARLKDATTGEYLYLDYMYDTFTFRTSANPPADQAKATITASSTNFTIYYKANGQTKYLSNANVIPSSTKTAWTFTDEETKVDFGDGTLHENEDYNMGTFTGLQYAVNKQNIAYKDEASLTGDKIKAKKQVWVGAGVYKRDPAVNSVANPIVDMDNENCFIIQDGVDVYGAFPKTGNPGKNERQALVSQYVHVLTERRITDASDYETILEPRTIGGSPVNVKRRVLGQPYKYNPDKGNDTKRGTPLYCGIDYIGVVWDGFTLRNGVWDSKGLTRPNRYGGSGAAIYKNVTLKNAVVYNNTTVFTDAGDSQDFRAGGIYMDGGILDAGYVINNLMEGWSSSGNSALQKGAAYGGGMYIYTGTVFNSVVSNNRIYSKYADGAGLFIENANFFNNTIVNNKAEGTTRASSGVAIWTDPGRGTESKLTLYNCIIAGNANTYIGETNSFGNENVCVPRAGMIELHHCLTTETDDIDDKHPSWMHFIECGAPVTDYSTIFVDYKDYDSSATAFNSVNLRLKAEAERAINTGDEAPVIGGAVYNLIDYNDMDFDERIQDCNIDIGAYEFNGATAVRPQEIGSEQAIYYVTPNGYGTTNANDPENAACAAKLQRVLDAAGRYKYLNPQKQVIVKVANSYDLLHPKNVDGEGHPIPPTDERYVYPSDFKYYATRTTDWTDQDVRVWSIIVPRGVEVWGGYSDIALNDDGTEYKEADKRKWDNTYNGFSFNGTDRRNITKYPTYFDSYYVNKLEKTDAHTYHVVTFSDRIFDKNGLAYTKEDFKDKSAATIRNILTQGASSAYIDLPGNDESLFAHMSEAISDVSTGVNGNVILGGDSKPKQIDGKYVSNRAVIDGIFVSGGQANASAQTNNSAVNINSYGGAALVNDFAYVRNCILTGNTATNGGALALTNNAFVSGCLILNNKAADMGGGIYVFENGTKLSNGTTVNTTAPDGQTMDFNMPHVFTSTIVQNNAQRGGGVWYNDYLANVRFNSVAVWQNTAAEQANVFGVINPEQPTDDETISEIFYPFSYSAIQDMRASGTNNLNLGGENHQGARFVDKTHDVQGSEGVNQTYIAEEDDEHPETKYAAFGYYGLTTYSLLCSNGMPKTMYNQLKEAIAISDVDILNTNRLPQDQNNIFVEIGARALEMVMPKKQLMLRLFVADPKYVDTKTAVRFMRLDPGEEPADKSSEAHKVWDAETYYSQVGSSFAYPFNSLQNALDYIKQARNGKIITDNYDAQNLPFEILVGRGEYYPKQSLNAETQNVWAATFAIPEGVTIMGGFNPQGGDTNSYYGRYYEKDATKLSSFTEGSIYDNVKLLSTVTSHVDPSATEIGHGNKFGEEKVTLPKITGESVDPKITFQQWNIQDIADRRAMLDNNKNGIVEPWEFASQTIISGNSVNGETDGVYHIMTAVADEDAVGRMPKVQSKKTSESEFTGYAKAIAGNPEDETGYQSMEEGQQIRLNGLIVTGGNALTYLSTALDKYGSYIFYQGAGLQVDGNRYKNNANTGLTGKAVFHNSAAYGVGYRDIPVSITNCQFRNNKAGYGGAISTNGSLTLFGSSFEQNIAYAQTEKPKSGATWKDINDNKIDEVNYPGQGGAIHATLQLSAFNTLFANNEACYSDDYYDASIALFSHKSFRVPSGAAGTLRAAGGAIMMGSAAQHHIVNCDFVRNKANAYPAVFTMNPTTKQDDVIDTHKYSQIINTVAWGNEVNPEMLAKYSGNTAYKTASKLMVNIGKKNRTTDYISDKSKKDFYSPEFVDGNVPTEDDLNVENPDAAPGATGTKNTWQEAAWFCAYEDGVGFKPNNTNDLRDAIVYTAGKFAPKMIKDANSGSYQNCNILIEANNDDVAGPNFGNPSTKAGYEGFTESADWSPSRFNRLTDNGNGWIKQVVTAETDEFKVTFKDSEGNGTGYQGAYPYTHYISDIITGQFPEYKLWIAIGNEKYMQATNDEVTGLTINGTHIGNAEDKTNRNIPRISPDPTMGVTKAYIDIGVYEYIKQPLLKPGSEVDILWVSTKEHPENGPADGMKWSTPTSDLQRAINTLLSSRNGHKKEIRIMEGEYTPVTPQTVGTKKYNAFVIDTKNLNEVAIVPSRYETDPAKYNYYAQSLTIKGGYSSEIPFEYDPSQYKTVIRQDDATSGVSTDKLIYIADPTVRYYYSSPTSYSSNQDGAVYTGTTESQSVRTMPIQIDGVTLINDKATANQKGTAIYYPDYEGASAPQANIAGSHSLNVAGTVTYYDKQENIGKAGHESDVPTDYLEVTGGETKSNPAKILINKTHIVGSGNKADAANFTGNPATEVCPSAVYIGKNGGSALIYNTVFHSNYGMPLDAWNTVNVNNTFGKNRSLVRLQDDAHVIEISKIHNSVMWENNGGAAQFSMPDVTIATEASGGVEVGDVSGDGKANFTYNSFTGGNTTWIKDTDPKITANNHNTGLVSDNTDIMNGPNFVDPENADIEARSYDIRPSLRLLNKGKDTNITVGGGATDGNYYTLVVSKNYDYSLILDFNRDALFRERLKKPRIDIGAHEFQGMLYQILYYDPNKPHDDNATGRNWEEAFGYGDLQNAMDLAAVYHLNDPSKEAYVFAKGNSSTNKYLNTNETLLIRDGVTTYGSITSSYTDWHDIEDAHGHQKYANVKAFIDDVVFVREGVASNAANKTIVTGIKTSALETFDGKTNNTPALVDGYVVTDPGQPTEPVLDVTNTSEKAVIALRNIIVADNDMSKAANGTNVAQISNGLLYEALLRDNKLSSTNTTGATLKVSNATVTPASSGVPYTTHGYAVNVTVEGKTVDALGGTPEDADGNNIYNSITNSVGNGNGNAAGADGPYGAIENNHISGYFYNIADPNLNYQLTETSKYIDMCSDSNPLDGVADNLKEFINYDTDRDLLGNPRYMRNVSSLDKIDRGAFETWKVDKSFYCGAGTYGTNKSLAIAPHFYPHDGSVVYVMENKTLVIDPLGGNEVKATPENPGFLLVKKGANFYGNGRPVTAAYVAIERDVRKTTGSIVSVPYDMQYNENVTKPIYTDGVLTKLDAETVSGAYEYNGLMRSDWKYIFQAEDTKCWNVISNNAVTAANCGVLFNAKDAVFNGADTEVLLRFTGKGKGLTDYIYTENGYSKDVDLTRKDDAESTNNGADYTDEKDMGWNCFGIPYLVIEYKPYTVINSTVTDAYGLIDIPTDDLEGAALTEATAKNDEIGAMRDDMTGKYMMHIPHTLWLYYDGTQAPDGTKTKPTMGDGGYYNVNSWDDSDHWHMAPTNPDEVANGEDPVYADPALWVGEGIFTQTATLQDTEALKFYLPVAPTEFPDPSSAKSVVRYYYDGTGIEETVSSDDVELIDTEYYTVDGLRIERPRRGQVVIIRNLYSNGSAKTSKMFVK